MDSAGTGQVKIWLLMGRPQDMDSLYDALSKRVEFQIKFHRNDSNNQNGDSDKVQKTENTECSTDDETVRKKRSNDDGEDESSAVEPESA